MRQDVEPVVVDRPFLHETWRRSMPGRRIILIIFMMSMMVTRSLRASGDGDDLPELGKPSEMPKIISTPATPPAKPAAPSEGSAVLALPGITAPGGTKPPVTPSPIEDPVPGGLLLEAPLEMKGSPTSPAPLPQPTPRSAPGRARAARPLVLESADDEPVPMDGPGPRTNPSTRRPTTSPRVEPEVTPPAQTQRRGRLFGLFPGPPAQAPKPAPAQASRSGTALPTNPMNTPGRSVVERASGDIAADSALKRRIEKQAREAVGDRVRTIDVRVVGKGAVVQARGVKLFQKRAVRKSLESIPALSGLQSTIEVLD